MRTSAAWLRKTRTASEGSLSALGGADRKPMKQLLCAVTVLAVFFLTAHGTPAASLFLQIPGIPGEQMNPGFPEAMLVQSLTITPGGFTIIKNVDGASPAILTAVATGTLFPSAIALLYNSTPVGSPDGRLSFQNVLGSSYQSQGGGTEQDSFVATNPGSMFMELPGIVGEDSTLGHPNVIEIESFSLTASQFSVLKAVDSASAAIILAVATGSPFASANVLFYNAAVPSGPANGIFKFGNVLGISVQNLGGAPAQERVTFSFATVIPVTPVLVKVGSRAAVKGTKSLLSTSFTITGIEATPILIRGLGPSLGVTKSLADPVLQLLDQTGAAIATNDDWRSSQASEIEATGLAPGNDRESAILTIVEPGSYTAVLSGKTKKSKGVGSVEVYDLNQL